VTLGLPFPSSSLKGIYASHVLEHFDGKRVRKLLSEFHRVLKQGGAIRLVVPSLEFAIRAYQRNDLTKLPEWPDKYDSLGGRFNNFMLCRNQHFMMYDFGLMEELLKESGFSRIFSKAPHSSLYFGRNHMSFESDPAITDSSLYVEAVKE
jgi:predicted SAM-dependent methyltransferase